VAATRRASVPFRREARERRPVPTPSPVRLHAAPSTHPASPRRESIRARGGPATPFVPRRAARCAPFRSIRRLHPADPSLRIAGLGRRRRDAVQARLCAVTDPPGEAVELNETERIVPHGAARTTWLVRHGRGWTRATDCPGASTAQREAGPGTVWERVVSLVLPAGTELMRVESRPRRPPARDPLSYLEKSSSKVPRATERTLYRVGVGGRVRRVVSAR